MRLLEITLPAADLDALRGFYCAALGLPEILPAWPGRLVIQCGATRLFFRAFMPGWQGRYHFAFAIPAARFAAACDWLLARCAPLADRQGQTCFHSQSWNADSLYFTDPQGSILELIARHDPVTPAAAPGEPGRPFSAEEILSICELGLATPDVPASVAVLQANAPALPVYSRSDSADFVALGDPGGLLIVVRYGRTWYPDTGVEADLLPLEALLEIEPGLRYRLTAPPYPFVFRPLQIDPEVPHA